VIRPLQINIGKREPFTSRQNKISHVGILPEGVGAESERIFGSQSYNPHHNSGQIIQHSRRSARGSHMKLSEAILLGSTVLAPRAGGQHFSETQEGCALGMAAVARGCTFHRVIRPVDDGDRRTLGVEGVWGDWVLKEVERPCDCWRIWIRRKLRVKDIIAHLFDYHIMDKRNWTLERLVAWVETVEPKETPLEFGPDLVIQRREAQWLEFQRFRQETEERLPVERQQAEEWQTVRGAFEARYASRRRRNFSARKEDLSDLAKD